MMNWQPLSQQSRRVWWKANLDLYNLYMTKKQTKERRVSVLSERLPVNMIIFAIFTELGSCRSQFK